MPVGEHLGGRYAPQGVVICAASTVSGAGSTAAGFAYYQFDVEEERCRVGRFSADGLLQFLEGKLACLPDG